MYGPKAVRERLVGKEDWYWSCKGAAISGEGDPMAVREQLIGGIDIEAVREQLLVVKMVTGDHQ